MAQDGLATYAAQAFRCASRELNACSKPASAPSGQTIVKPTALGSVANTDTKLLIYGLFQKGRVLAQDGVDTPTMRTSLSKAAKASGWYKRQDRGQEWVAAIEQHLDDPSIQNSDLMRKLSALRAWIDDA